MGKWIRKGVVIVGVVGETVRQKGGGKKDRGCQLLEGLRVPGAGNYY